jgi:hypothetical protein
MEDTPATTFTICTTADKLKKYIENITKFLKLFNEQSGEAKINEKSS